MKIQQKASQPPPKRTPKKKSKLTVTFDEESRKEFITGFHRRKQQRRKHAEKVKKEQDRLQKCENRRLKRQYQKEILQSLDSAVLDANSDQEPEETSHEQTMQVGSAKVTISEAVFED